MAEHYLKAEYSVSNRAGCRGCGSKIAKKELRIAYVVDIDQQYHSEKWHHFECFTDLAPSIKKMEKITIHGIDNLYDEDQEKVKQKIERLKSQGQNRKKNSKKDKSASKQINLESEEEKKVSEEPAKKRRESKKATQTKQKKRKMEEEEEVEEDMEEEDDDDEVAPREVQYAGYDEKQRKEYEKVVNDLLKCTIGALKEKLKKNDQSCTGTKKELVEKVADGMVLGSIPRCHHCGGGRLRFNNKLGIYHCPGYMEDTDFVHCNKKFMGSEIERGKWQS